MCLPFFTVWIGWTIAAHVRIIDVGVRSIATVVWNVHVVIDAQFSAVMHVVVGAIIHWYIATCGRIACRI